MTWSRPSKNFLRQTSSLKLQFARGATCALSLAALSYCTDAHAQVGQEKIKSGAKGTVGLALLGAESVMAVEAAIGVQPWWGYAIGGGAGAVAGGVGGYFVDQANSPELSMSLLVGGLVFAIPTTIAILSATAYRPEKNPTIEDDLTVGQRQEERLQLATYQSTAFVGVDETGSVGMKMPAVEIRQVYSKKSRQMYSLPEAASVRVPLFSITF